MLPFVRRLIVCEDVQHDPSNPARRIVSGLNMHIRCEADERFPLARCFCIYAEFSSIRRTGAIHINIVHGDSLRTVYRSVEGLLPITDDPLKFLSATFRIQHCLFPDPALYWVELCYDSTVIAEEMFLVEGQL